MDAEVVVIGAGPAGLAVAACLGRRGIDPVVLERGPAIAASWRGRYDRLRLHTPRRQSGLPGLPIPRRFGRWVARDDFVRYLVGYARHHDLRVQIDTDVRRVDRTDGAWTVATSDGAVTSRQVVVATGYNNRPRLPAWPGSDGFTGRLLHAGDYREPSPFREQEVLVVGTGNTGAEIAADLAEAGAPRVWLAVRTPPHIVPRQVGPIPITLLSISQDLAPPAVTDPLSALIERVFVGDLGSFGLPPPTRGLAAQFRSNGVVPVIDVGLVRQLEQRRVEPVAAVEAFDGAEVVLADGRRLQPDVVIAATGYTTALEPMVGHLPVLDEHGRPVLARGDAHPDLPGLRFVGLTNPLKGLLLQINLDARAAARRIAAELRD